MTPRTSSNERANAEILGVVILIGIFAITAGIISATVLATPEPVKVPAASIEITQPSENVDVIRIAHLGGDPVPLDDLIVRAADTNGPVSPIQGAVALRAWLGLEESDSAFNNGYDGEVSAPGWVAAALVYQGNDGESVIARWDPTGIYGPLGPPAVSGNVPEVPTSAPTQPAWPTPTTAWNHTVQNITANFTQSRTAAAVNEPVQFTNTSTGNVTIDAWSWNFGDGTISTLENPTHSYNNTGNYTVTFTAMSTSTGASDTVVKERCVQVGPPNLLSPVDFEIAPEPPVGGVSQNFTCIDRSKSSPTLWRWTAINGTDAADRRVVGPAGITDTDDPRTQTFWFNNTAGAVNNTCTIILEVWSPYFESPISITKYVTVGPPLRADFRSADLTNWSGTAGFYGKEVHFQDVSPGIPETWRWDFENDGVVDSTEQNPVHNFTVGPNEIKTFPVTLTVTGWNQAPIPVTHIVTIYPPVAANSTANRTSGAAPLAVQFNDTSTGFPDEWKWDFGDGATSSERNPVHIYTRDGKFTVTLTPTRTEPHSADAQTSEIIISVGDDITANFIANPRWGDATLKVQFNETSTGDTKWYWDFGDGGYSLEPNPVHTYTIPDNYTVSLEAQNLYRNAIETKPDYISVIGPVSASFTGLPRAVQNGSAVRFTDTSTGNPYNFSWTFGDSGTSKERNPSHIYTKAGTYDVSLTADNPNFTSAPKVEPGYIVVYDQVNASFTANTTGGPAPLHVRFTDRSTGNPAPNSWLWDFGDGTTQFGNQPGDRTPIHLYKNPGTYDVTLTASNGYSTEKSTYLRFVITVYGDLTTQFTANQSAGPRPLAVQFNDTTTGNPSAWAWDFGDGTTFSTTDPAQKNASHTFPSAGTWGVTLTASHAGGSFPPSTRQVTVYEPITASYAVNESTGVAPLWIEFTDTSTGGADSRRWEFGDGGVSSEAKPVHTFGPGIHTVNLTVWHHLREDLNRTVSGTIISYGIPNATFTASKVTGNAPLTVQFTDTSDGDPTQWDWDFGDGTTFSTTDPAQKNPSHTFTERGRAYTVTLRVLNPAGMDPTPATRSITVM